MARFNDAPKGIRLVRLVRGLRQYDLEAFTGISAAVIGRIERGERPASAAELAAIAKALCVPVQELSRASDPA